LPPTIPHIAAASSSNNVGIYLPNYTVS